MAPLWQVYALLSGRRVCWFGPSSLILPTVVARGLGWRVSGRLAAPLSPALLAASSSGTAGHRRLPRASMLVRGGGDLANSFLLLRGGATGYIFLLKLLNDDDEAEAIHGEGLARIATPRRWLGSRRHL